MADPQKDPDYDEYQQYLEYLGHIKSQSQPQQEQGQSALGLLGKGASAIDSVTGAPTRSAISAAQNADRLIDIPGEALKAGWKQFGADPKTAPTGQDIVKKAGVPDQSYGEIPSPFPGAPAMQLNPSKIAGFGMDMAANPLNFVGGAAKLVGKGADLAGAAESVAGSLKNFAHEKAIKAAGAMTKDFNAINDKGMQEALGSFLLDNKMVTPLSTVSKVADRLETAKESAGKTIGHILDTSDASHAPKISARDIALNLSEDPEIAGLGKIPTKEKVASQINGYLETLYKNGDELSLRDAQKLRQGIDSSINFNKRIPDMADAQQYLYKMRDAISEQMNNSVNSLGGEFDSLKKANNAYSKISTLDKIANNRIAALSSNRTISLTDTIGGFAGGAASLASGHSPVGAAAAGAGLAIANKAARTFGAPVMATGANKLAQGVKAAPGLIKAIPNNIGQAASALTGEFSPGLIPSRAPADKRDQKK